MAVGAVSLLCEELPETCRNLFVFGATVKELLFTSADLIAECHSGVKEVLFRGSLLFTILGCLSAVSV